MQQRNPIRSGEMIKGEVSAGREWREPRQLPARGARAPPGSAGAGAAQPAERGAWAEQPDVRSWAPRRSPFPISGAPPLPPSCRRTPGSLTVSQESQQRGQEQQGSRAHGVGYKHAPGRGRGERAGRLAGRGHGKQKRVQLGKGSGPPPPPPAPDRISTTASAWRRRPGSPRGLGGGGAGGAVTVESQVKAQETQRRDHRLPHHRQLRGRNCSANVGKPPPPFCAAHAHPTWSPSFH